MPPRFPARSLQSANSRSRAISSEKMPSASVTANPKIRLPNWPCAADGLRSAAERYWPKITPTPTPAPPMPMHAMPAPMNFAAKGSIAIAPVPDRWANSVARVNRIVEIDAGEDGEDVSLKERDQQFEGGQRDHHAERQHAAGPADEPETRAQQRNEAGENLQCDVAREHVGEQTNAMRDRPQEEREHLDEHNQRQDEHRNAARHEQLEEPQAVLLESVDHHGEEHEQRERHRDDDVAGHGEGIGDQTDDIRHQDEHE